MIAGVVYHEHPAPHVELSLDDSTKITRPVQEGENAKEATGKMLQVVGALMAAVVLNQICTASTGAPRGDAN